MRRELVVCQAECGQNHRPYFGHPVTFNLHKSFLMLPYRQFKHGCAKTSSRPPRRSAEPLRASPQPCGACPNKHRARTNKYDIAPTATIVCGLSVRRVRVCACVIFGPKLYYTIVPEIGSGNLIARGPCAVLQVRPAYKSPAPTTHRAYCASGTQAHNNMKTVLILVVCLVSTHSGGGRLTFACAAPLSPNPISA